jgi:hypothetical protein
MLACCNADAANFYAQYTNYEGHIGNYPIYLSIQKDEWVSDLTVMGSYYYQRHTRRMTPIPLYGRYDKRGKLSLCEILTEEQLAEFKRKLGQKISTAGCAFSLAFTGNAARGYWTDGKQKLAVTLNMVGDFRFSTQPGSGGSGKFNIPYWGQTARHFFVGVYDMRSGPTVDVIDKHSRQIIQTLKPEDDGCIVGAFLSPIYMSAESHGPRDAGQIRLRCADSSKSSNNRYYAFNQSIGKFERINAP